LLSGRRNRIGQGGIGLFKLAGPNWRGRIDLSGQDYWVNLANGIELA